MPIYPLIKVMLRSFNNKYMCVSKLNQLCLKSTEQSLQNKSDGTYTVGRKTPRNYGNMQLTAKQATA